jgi:hypothetical protein
VASVACGVCLVLAALATPGVSPADEPIGNEGGDDGANPAPCASLYDEQKQYLGCKNPGKQCTNGGKMGLCATVGNVCDCPVK